MQVVSIGLVVVVVGLFLFRDHPLSENIASIWIIAVTFCDTISPREYQSYKSSNLLLT